MLTPKVVLFFRCPSIYYSIERVFNTVVAAMPESLGAKKINVPHSRANIWSILRNMWYVYQHRGDINHITGDIHYCALALPKHGLILTIHDLIPLENSRGLRRWIFKLLWYSWPIRRAEIVTCISEYTRNALLKRYPWAEDKCFVIHNPISDDYTSDLHSFNAELPVILHIGTRENKNLIRVIESLAGISCHLRIIGHLSLIQQELLQKHGVNYSVVADLTDAQIVQEYRNCDIVSFPSLYEGFGMPVIEAQAIGRVILISSIPPLIEIAGDKAVIVDPYDSLSIKQGFQSLIANEVLRDELIQSGFKNIKGFQSKIITGQYLSLYKTINKR